MNTIIELVKEIFQMIIFISVLGFVTRLFLAHTLLGKIIAVTVKNVYLTLRGCIRIVKYLTKKIYEIGKSTNTYLTKKIPTNSKKKSTRQTKRKVVNGNNNVIDFKSAKHLRHKWSK